MKHSMVVTLAFTSFIQVGCAVYSGDDNNAMNAFGPLPPPRSSAPVPITAEPFPGRPNNNARSNSARMNDNSAFAMGYSNSHSPQMLPPSLTPALTRIEGNIWRTSLDATSLFGMINRYLAQDYIIATVDPKSFTIATDWDKFFIEGKLFRNRMNISVFPLGQRQTELIIKNAVEYYSEQSGDQESNRWLPCADITNEVEKIAESINKQTAMFNGYRSRSR